MEFGFIPALIMLVDQRECFRQHLQPFLGLGGFLIDLSQQGKRTGSPLFCPSGTVGGNALVYLSPALLYLYLHGERPPAQHRSRREPEWKRIFAESAITASESSCVA